MRTSRIRVLILSWALGVAGCGDRPRQGAPEEATPRAYPAGWPTEAERTLEPGKAPTPYSAAQLRASDTPGRRYTFRVVAEGKPPATTHVRFTGGDEVEARFEVASGEDEATLAWRPVAAPWKALQAHGSYDAARTTITFEGVVVPAGKHDAVVYEVREGEGEGEGEKRTVTKHWFALDLPGPPVRTVVTKDGKVVSEQELLRFSKGS